MASAKKTFPEPTPNGVALWLTYKEAVKLREFLNLSNKVNDEDGTVRNVWRILYEAMAKEAN